MPGFQHILVALDGSPGSELSLRAAETAAATKGKLTLVRVADDLIADNYLPEDMDKQSLWSRQVEPVQTYLDTMSARLDRQDLNIDTLVASGHPANTILDLVEKLDVQAVCICRHSKSRWERIVLGSVGQKILSKCPVPVIVVHPPEQ